MKRHRYFFKNNIKKTIKNSLYKKSLVSLKNMNVNYNTRQFLTNILHVKYRLVNVNKLHLFCLVTGKTKFVMKNFKLAKMPIIENLSKGFLTGFYKN